MNHMITRTVLAVGILAIGLGSALAQGPRGGDGNGPRAERGGEGRMLQRLEGLLDAYDTDNDGAVTQAEIDAVRVERFGRFDADGDGGLTLEEYEALWLDAMRERMVDRFQAHDDDGDGSLTEAEFAERQARLVVRLDRNGDGVLDPSDLRRNGRGRPAAAD